MIGNFCRNSPFLFLIIFVIPLFVWEVPLLAATFSVATSTKDFIDHTNSFGTDEFNFKVTPTPNNDDYELRIAIFDSGNKLVNHFYSGSVTTNGQHTVSLNWDGTGDFDANPETTYTDNTAAHKLASGTYKAVISMTERPIFDFSIGFGKSFSEPMDCHLDNNGNLVVINHADGIGYLMKPNGNLTSRFGSTQWWRGPEGIAVDNQGTKGIYVSATDGNSIDGVVASTTTVRKIVQSGGEWVLDYAFETNLKATATFRITGGIEVRGPKGLCVNPDNTGTEYIWISGTSTGNKGCIVKAGLDGKPQWMVTGSGFTNANAILDIAVIVSGGNTFIYAVRDDADICRLQENAGRTGFVNDNGTTLVTDGNKFRNISVDDLYIYATDNDNNNLRAYLRSNGNAVFTRGTHGATPLGDDLAFVAPRGVASDRGRNKIWVADSFRNTGNPTYGIYRYDIDGAGASSFTVRLESDPFTLGEPAQVFVNQANGDWFVADGKLNQAKKFDSYGNYQALYNAASFSTGLMNGVSAVTVDSGGTVYVGDSNSGEVMRFNGTTGIPLDAYPTVFASGFTTGGLNGISSLWVENFNGTDYIFIADYNDGKIYGYQVSAGPNLVKGIGNILEIAPANKPRAISFSHEKYLYVAGTTQGIYKYRHTAGTTPATANFTQVAFEDAALPQGNQTSGELRAIAPDYFGDMWLPTDDWKYANNVNPKGSLWKAGNDGDQPGLKTSDSVTGFQLYRGPSAARADTVKLGDKVSELGAGDGQILEPMGAAVYPRNSFVNNGPSANGAKYLYLSEKKNGRVTRFKLKWDDWVEIPLTLGSNGAVASPTVAGFEVVGHPNLNPYQLAPQSNPFTVRVTFTRQDMDQTVGIVVVNTAGAQDVPVTLSSWINGFTWEGTMNLPFGDDGLADLKIKNFRVDPTHNIGQSPNFTFIYNDVININSATPTITLLTMDGQGLAPPPAINITDQNIVVVAGTTSPGNLPTRVFNYDDPNSVSPVNLTDSQDFTSQSSGNFSANNINLVMGLNYLTASTTSLSGIDSGLITPRFIINRVENLPGVLSIAPGTSVFVGTSSSWTLTYSALSDIGSKSNNLGKAEYLEIVIPDGWSPPTVTEGVRGYVKLYPSSADTTRVDLATETLQAPGTYSFGVSGQVLKVYFDYLQSGQGFDIIYADPSDDNPPPNTPPNAKVGDPENQIVLGSNLFSSILWTASGTVPATAVLASASLNPPAIEVLPRPTTVSVLNLLEAPYRYVDADTNGQYTSGEKIFIDSDDDGVGWATETYINGASGNPDTANVKYFPTDDLTAGSVSNVFYDTDNNGTFENTEPIIRDANNNKKFDAGDTEIINPGIVTVGDGLKLFHTGAFAGKGDIEVLKLTLVNPNPNHPMILRGLTLHVRDEAGNPLDPDTVLEWVQIKDNGEAILRQENNPFNKVNEKILVNMTANTASVTFTSASNGIARVFYKIKPGLAGGTVLHVGFEENSDFEIKDKALKVDAPVALGTGMSYSTTDGTMRGFNQTIHRYIPAGTLAIVPNTQWVTNTTNLSKSQTGSKNFILNFSQPISGEGEIEITEIKLTVEGDSAFPLTDAVGISPLSVFVKVVAQPPLGIPFKVVQTEIDSLPATLTIDLSAKPIVATSFGTTTAEILVDITASPTPVTPYWIRTNIYNTGQFTAKDRILQSAIATFTGTGSVFPYLAPGDGFARLYDTADINVADVSVIATSGIAVVAKPTGITAIIGDPIDVQVLVQHVSGTATASFDSSGTNPPDLEIFIGVVNVTSEFNITTVTRPSQVGNGQIATFVYRLEQIYGSSVGTLTIDTATLNGVYGPIAFDSNDAVDATKIVVTDTDGAASVDNRLAVAKSQVDIFPLAVNPHTDMGDPPLAPASDDAYPASTANVLVTSVYITRNNTSPATKIAFFTWKMTGDADNSHFGTVKLWRDQNADLGDRIFDPATDNLVATGTLSGGQVTFNYMLTPYDELVDNASVPFYISVDIVPSSTLRMDGKTINGEIPINGVEFDNGFRAESSVLTSMATASHKINIRANKLTLVPVNSTAATNSTKAINLEAQDSHGNRDYDSTKNLIIALSESIPGPPNTASFTSATLQNISPALPGTSFNGDLVAGAGQISIKDVTLVSETVYASITSAFPFASGSIDYQSGISVSAVAVGAQSVPPLATGTILSFDIYNSSGADRTISSMTITMNNTLDADIGTISLVVASTSVVVQSLTYTGGDVEFTGLGYLLPQTPEYVGFEIRAQASSNSIDGNTLDGSLGINQIGFLAFTPPQNVPDQVIDSGGVVEIDIVATKILVSADDGVAQVNSTEQFTITAVDTLGNKDVDFSGNIKVTSAGDGADQALIDSNTFATVSSGGNGFKFIAGTLNSGESTVTYKDGGLETAVMTSSDGPPGLGYSSDTCIWNDVTIHGLNVYRLGTWPSSPLPVEFTRSSNKSLNHDVVVVASGTSGGVFSGVTVIRGGESNTGIKLWESPANSGFYLASLSFGTTQNVSASNPYYLIKSVQEKTLITVQADSDTSKKDTLYLYNGVGIKFATSTTNLTVGGGAASTTPALKAQLVGENGLPLSSSTLDLSTNPHVASFSTGDAAKGQWNNFVSPTSLANGELSPTWTGVSNGDTQVFASIINPATGAGTFTSPINITVGIPIVLDYFALDKTAVRSTGYAPPALYDLKITASGTPGFLTTSATVSIPGNSNVVVRLDEEFPGTYTRIIRFVGTSTDQTKTPPEILATKEGDTINVAMNGDASKNANVKLFNVAGVKFATPTLSFTVISIDPDIQNLDAHVLGEDGSVLNPAIFNLAVASISFITNDTGIGVFVGGEAGASIAVTLGSATLDWDILSIGATTLKAYIIDGLTGLSVPSTNSISFTVNPDSIGTFTIEIRYPGLGNFVLLNEFTANFTIETGKDYEFRISPKWQAAPSLNASFTEFVFSNPGAATSTYSSLFTLPPSDIPGGNFINGSATLIASFTHLSSIATTSLPTQLVLFVKDTVLPTNNASSTVIVNFIASETATYGASSTLPIPPAVAVGPGNPFFLSGWIRQDLVTMGAGRVVLTDYDAGGVVLGTRIYEIPHRGDKAGKWYFFEFPSFEINALTTKVNIQVGAINGKVWFDGLQLEKSLENQTSPSRFSDGPVISAPDSIKGFSGKDLKDF